MHRLVLCMIIAISTLLCGFSQGFERLEPLIQPGPWSGVSKLIGYGNRLWFVNSEKFRDHNSADVYSYDPTTGTARYERHLFSQDAGVPVVADGKLYWPFEDPRFSTGRGEYLVTNGEDWRWRMLPAAQVYHIHAVTEFQGALYAATSAWRAGLQRSDDGGISWEVIYDHPTASGRVSRITDLAVLSGTLYAGLTAYNQEASKLLRYEKGGLKPVTAWPAGISTHTLEVYGGWLYGVNQSAGDYAVWRTDGAEVERVTALDGYIIRALAAGPDALWAVNGRGESGALWRSFDGITWSKKQSFSNSLPLDVEVYAGRLYVGANGPGGRGTLWGPPPPAPAEATITPASIPEPPIAKPLDLQTVRAQLTTLFAMTPTDASYRTTLRSTLLPLAFNQHAEIGAVLSQLLNGPFYNASLTLFGGKLEVSVSKFTRWHLLWAMGLNRHGRVPLRLLRTPWDATHNRAEKYLEPRPAAAWTIAQLNQDDPGTVATLVDILGTPNQPHWVDGDLVGALTVLTGRSYGHDIEAWKAWWSNRAFDSPQIRIPMGTFDMGSVSAESNERPLHRVQLSGFSIDRYEVTNAAFTAFVAATNHLTDPELSGIGWHWDGEWRSVRGANWRHPDGPDSTIDGRDYHPVVQVSWQDANAYCHWRGRRLPTEAEWEFSARGGDARTYSWGNQPPRHNGVYKAAYGSDDCCRTDENDGYLTTAPVGTFPAGQSPFLVHDLTGNVWEWVEDWFDPEFYQRSPALDPVNRKKAKRKVIRGGGWGNNAYGLRTTLRHANPPDTGLSMVGFRCAG